MIDVNGPERTTRDIMSLDARVGGSGADPAAGECHGGPGRKSGCRESSIKDYRLFYELLFLFKGDPGPLFTNRTYPVVGASLYEPLLPDLEVNL